MRIVLTNAGKKEIIIDETDKLPVKNLHSEEKVKYNPKLLIPSTKRESVKHQLNKFSDFKIKITVQKEYSLKIIYQMKTEF